MTHAAGYWATIILIGLVIVPIQLVTVYILFRYGLPAIWKAGWQQPRSPAAKRLFVATMIGVVALEVAPAVWIG